VTPSKRDNSEARRDRLIRDYHAYNERIDNAMNLAAEMSREKSETLWRLREMFSVVEIADLLGVTRQAVYNGLKDAPSDVVPPEADDLRTALKQYLNATKDAERWIGPFFESELALTVKRREMVAEVMDRLRTAQHNYDMALERVGRRAPNRGAPNQRAVS
jgi:hypothetical protein